MVPFLKVKIGDLIMTVRKEKITREEYDALSMYMKNRIEPVFIDEAKDLKEEVVEVLEPEILKEEEQKEEEKVVYSYTDLKDMNKKQQIKILKDAGLDSNAIKSLKTEKERIDSILSLQKE